MKNYLIIVLIIALTLFIESCLASIGLVTPLTLSSTNIHVGDSLDVYANWNETVNSFVIEYNSTSSDLMNVTVDNNSTWTNYTILMNGSWLLGPHSVRIYVLSSVEEGILEAATDQSNFNVLGYSKSLIQLSSDNITIGSPIIVTCRVVDANTSNPIANYYVEATSSLGGDIPSVAGLTDSGGYREGNFTTMKSGVHVITCVIDDDIPKFYTALTKGSSNLTVNLIVIPGFTGKGILNVERALIKSGLIEMPSGLNATLKDYTIVINNQENSTMNFSLYIGNQLVLENSIPANESYTINYSTIMDWKETYHLTNLHKVRIKVEGTHGFKSLITQNFTDVYADIIVNKKYPKNYEINVSSSEHVQNVLMEGEIPSEIDVNNIKLYHWNEDNKAYEDVTGSSQYSVTVYKMDRKISFTVPSLSTQSFILAEGGIVTPTPVTTTTSTTSTTYKATTTTKTTLKQMTTTIVQCPTCSKPSEWSECVNGQKSRTNYKCDQTTNYKCQSFTETQSCVVPTDYSLVIVIILVIVLIVYLAWKFNILEKIQRRKFKYRYKHK
jgi:hypothetical protein